MDRSFGGGGDNDNDDRRDSGTRRVAPANLAPLIVFADDSAVQSLRMRELLEEAGYRTVGAVDGTSAVRRTEELRPDMVILDLEMPGLDGVAALTEIKSRKHLAHIPVLILTAHEEPKYLVSSFEAGCAGYLVKGQADVVLLGKIARHIGSPRRALARGY